MKITLSENAVLDSLYARSALGAYIAEHPGSYASNILTTAQAPACRRVIADAFAAAIAWLAPEWALCSEPLTAEAPDGLPYDDLTVKTLLQVAVTALAEHLILAASLDRRADAPRETAVAILQNLASRVYSVATCAPSR